MSRDADDDASRTCRALDEGYTVLRKCRDAILVCLPVAASSKLPSTGAQENDIFE